MILEDTTMFEVLNVTGLILGTKIGGLPTKVNKVQNFTKCEKWNRTSKNAKK